MAMKTKSSKVSEQGACCGAEDEEDSELRYLNELLAAEERKGKESRS